MQRVELDKDIKPISEFRSKATSFIKQVHKTKRPLVITHHGKSAAILMDICEYEVLLEKLELLQDIHLAETQIHEGKGVSHYTAKKHILEKFNK